MILSVLMFLNLAARAEKVGVVLPMTGKYQSVSQKTLRGLELGLGLDGKTKTSIELSIVDSEGSADVAQKNAEKLIKDDNVLALVGSPLSKTSNSVAKKATEFGVPYIDLSQKSGVTELGSGVYRNAVTSEMIVSHLVQTAMSKYGMKKFAILYPNDSYGVELANLFWDQVLARGGQITSVQIYDPKETDFRDPIQRLTGTYYIEARIEEYQARRKELASKKTKHSSRENTIENVLPAIADFDGIFIPDTVKAMGQIAAMLAFNDIRDTWLLGTNLWNVEGVEKRAGLFAEKTLFVDGFWSGDAQLKSSHFYQSYQSTFNEEPSLFDLIGYDTGLLIKSILEKGKNSRADISEELQSRKGFIGGVGPVQLAPDHEFERPLFSLGIQKGQVIRVE